MLLELKPSNGDVLSSRGGGHQVMVVRMTVDAWPCGGGFVIFDTSDDGQLLDAGGDVSRRMGHLT